MKLQYALLGLHAGLALANPEPLFGFDFDFNKPRVNLPSGGTITGKSALYVETFNTIPFADPPVGELRLKPPRKFSGRFGTRDGSGGSPACPQMLPSWTDLSAMQSKARQLSETSFFDRLSGQEDCLYINVQRPSGTKAGDKLPVLFWIFPGGFEMGSNMMDGGSLLRAARLNGQPFVFVAVNYRLGGFGFMPGREILRDGSANLGLLDQRLGLEWVADNIAAFGGDAAKLTIWGVSAGAISVLDQMALYGGNATYKGRPLFRGAIMNSGGIIPADAVDCAKGQAVYDQVVREAGCSGAGAGAGDGGDTLACLRRTDYRTFLRAANSVPSMFSYQSVALSYLPRPDGTVLPDSPDNLVLAGRYHAVPMIVGNQEDEGTIFAMRTTNVTTPDLAADYLAQFYFHGASRADITELVRLYEPSIAVGSPFRTGRLNEWYPGFKRLSAMLGDLTFTLTRRFMLNMAFDVNPNVPAWSYLASYSHRTPLIGTFHASDLAQIFLGVMPNYATLTCRTYYFNFIHNLDPNKGVTWYANWPKWGESKKLMWFKTPYANGILPDNFRNSAAEYIVRKRRAFRI
jgi:carboxylesterase type B